MPHPVIYDSTYNSDAKLTQVHQQQNVRLHLFVAYMMAIIKTYQLVTKKQPISTKLIKLYHFRISTANLTLSGNGKFLTP